ncbi:unnamed protein product [Blepharisma stoltei]|uniref:Uncharacterized protein n=1 Tax=Blepharisma stoltei TaxID=1481888 RepID=A0AAU9IPU4_9CILI|nr:unnamed protein product [Blepharisma stoltei]
MAIKNTMCILKRNDEICNHYECHLHYSLQENSVSSMNFMVLEAMSRNSMAISNLCDNHLKIMNEINSLKQICSQIRDSISVDEQILPDQNLIVRRALLMVKENYDFPIRLELDKTFPSKICKERGFKLSFHLENNGNQAIKTQRNAKFNIFLVTHNEPPIVLDKNLSGKSILRGTHEAAENENGHIQFSNIVVNEVSSHYKENSFIFIVLCLSNLNIKPFIKWNLNIRARQALKNRRR